MDIVDTGANGLNPFAPKPSTVDRHDDVRFRGKSIDSLSREEAIEALRQALTQVKHLTGHRSGFNEINIGL